MKRSERFFLQYRIQDLLGWIIGEGQEHLKPIILVAVQTGMRKGELLALRWEDLDFDQNRILVRNSKNERPRKIPMSTEVRNLLLILQNRRYHPERVFARRNGQPVNNFNTAWFGALKRAGLVKGDVRFHDLRHHAEFRIMPSCCSLPAF